MSRATFRRSKKAAKEMSKSGGGGEYGPWGLENYQMEIREQPAMARFLNPGDEGFLVISQHRLGYKTHTCTSEMAEFDGKCCFCHYWAAAAPKSDDKKNLYPRTTTVAELIDFRYHHIVEEIPKGKTESKKVLKRCAFNEAVPARGQGRSRTSCKWCDSKDPKVAERIFGGHKIWELSNKLRDRLDGIDTDLGHTAFLIDDGQTVALQAFTIGFRCANCKELLLDENKIREMIGESGDEVEAFAAEDQECPHCHHIDLPEEVWVAEGEVGGEAFELDMDEPSVVRAGLFDKNLEVTCPGESRKQGKTESEFRAYDFDKSRYDWGNAVDDLVSHGLKEDEISEMIKPWDLPHRYRPEFISRAKYEENGQFDTESYVAAVLEAQAKALDRPNPYAVHSTGTRAREFQTGGGGRQFRTRS